jgi:hypothetical protein
MAEYRAFDKHGVIMGVEELGDTDAGIAWGVKIGLHGAALIERKVGDDWVCFQEFRDKRAASPSKP